MARRYADVFFEFVSAEYDPSSIRGMVIDRGDEMTLEIQGEEVLYSITGERINHYFSGRDGDVMATWAQLADAFVGVWVEAGDEYFFRFRLSAAQSTE